MQEIHTFTEKEAATLIRERIVAALDWVHMEPHKDDTAIVSTCFTGAPARCAAFIPVARRAGPAA